MAVYIFGQCRTYHWRGSYLRGEGERTKIEIWGDGIRVSTISASYSTYYPTDIIHNGWRLFKIGGGRIACYTHVNAREEQWKHRWVNTGCDRILIRETDYQRLLEKAGKE